jgi:predicted metalloprotease with PDZ domain
MHFRSSFVAGIAATALGCVPSAVAAPTAVAGTVGPLELAVDATDVARGLYHAHLRIPARAGELVLAYAKWIPGEHAPTGPAMNMLGPRIAANGKPLSWRRDGERVFEIHVTVPAGVTSIDLDYDVATSSNGVFSGARSVTPKLLDLAWNQVVLYPKGPALDHVTVTPSIKLPAGWKHASALTAASETGGVVSYKTVTLETLIDSPVVAGEHFKTFELGTSNGAAHHLSMVADSDEALAAPDSAIAGWKKLVLEAHALFGARHYDDYRFLLTASDSVDSFGLEHHQSSDNRVRERSLIDDDLRRGVGGLLAHEYVHSWNGKYRRPKGLVSPTLQEPMRGELLWVYEGLTSYLGWVLSTRSGLASLDDARAELALSAGYLDQPGRKWRPLVDTADASQLLIAAPTGGASLRRSLDYYPEGLLIWLEVDVTIREASGGKKSIDDFCRAFFGGVDAGPEVRAYDLDELVKTLDGVVAHDWKGFFQDRVYKVADAVPLGGITHGGWKLAYTDKKPDLLAAWEKADKTESYADSLGFGLGENGVGSVIEGGPAAKAGLASGMKLVAVDGRKYSAEVLKDAIARAKSRTAPIELLVEQNEFYRTLKVDWHGGERWWTLERDAAKTDWLAKILEGRDTATNKAKRPEVF